MQETPVETSGALTAALKKCLRPLVRFLITHNLTLPYFYELLKKVYVDVAAEDFDVNGKPPSDSRVSLITGVHRKDVRRLRGLEDEDESTPRAVSLGAQLIATWISDRRYRNRDGSPKSLPLRSPTSRRISFEDLVADVARQDIRPRVVLDELVRLELVELVDGDRVTLNVEAFVPRVGMDEKLHYFGQNLRDHIAAAAHNVNDDGAPMLERAVSYHGLSDSDVETLEKLAVELSMDALKEINRRARRMKQRNAGKLDQARRINFGTYFYHADDESDDA